MKILKNVLLVLLVAIAGVLALAATRPDHYRIERGAKIAAAPAVVFAQVDDFHRWGAWSPWEKLDPAMKREIAGAPAGTGATYHWVGNDQVGEGRMTITDSRAPQSVAIRLEFIEPWTATNTTQFDFAPSSAGTNVTWTMTGHNNFMAKAFGLFMDMEKMVGPDFEKGLVNLDTATAAAAREAPATTPVS